MLAFAALPWQSHGYGTELMDVTGVDTGNYTIIVDISGPIGSYDPCDGSSTPLLDALLFPPPHTTVKEKRRWVAYVSVAQLQKSCGFKPIDFMFSTYAALRAQQLGMELTGQRVFCMDAWAFT